MASLGPHSVPRFSKAVQSNGGLSLMLSPEVLEQIAELVVPLLAERNGPDPWIGVAEAAEHIGARPARIYALVSARRIPFEKDGSRVLFKRSELDAWVRAGGGVRP